MPGPAPKPTALKVIAGNPGKRALNRNEPVFTGVPICPGWLTPEAKKEWGRVVDDLAAMDMIRSVDSAALAGYCQAYARWRSAEEQVSLEGQTVREPIINKAGDVVGHKIRRHPATVIAMHERAAMVRFSSLFGFDPSSRSRIDLGNAQPKEDSFEQFMKSAGASGSTKKYKEISD